MHIYIYTQQAGVICKYARAPHTFFDNSIVHTVSNIIIKINRTLITFHKRQFNTYVYRVLFTYLLLQMVIYKQLGKCNMQLQSFLTYLAMLINQRRTTEGFFWLCNNPSFIHAYITRTPSRIITILLCYL